ncbi:hypothetical protein EVAR_47785_1 [Eumeta japonica]|uniref:Uncharacterized protein n=1 Tax=Eumeta variegata TaxID=151549 RepID=A0A4C1XX47_EUMVA|nr:hypothetical protein EVAR_47785_1 [Eumeta japonica]
MHTYRVTRCESLGAYLRHCPLGGYKIFVGTRQRKRLIYRAAGPASTRPLCSGAILLPAHLGERKGLYTDTSMMCAHDTRVWSTLDRCTLLLSLFKSYTFKFVSLEKITLKDYTKQSLYAFLTVSGAVAPLAPQTRHPFQFWQSQNFYFVL